MSQPSTTVDDLVRALVEHGLLAEEVIEDSFHELGHEQRQSPHEVACHFIRHKLLTKFQAIAAYQGTAARLKVGNYLLLDKLGEGGMGTVYRAEHLESKQQVAIKILLATALQ